MSSGNQNNFTIFGKNSGTRGHVKISGVEQTGRITTIEGGSSQSEQAPVTSDVNNFSIAESVIDDLELNDIKQTGSVYKYTAAENNSNQQDSSDKNTPTNFAKCFDVIEEIGSGAFGKVFKARHKIDKQLYAVKMIEIQESKALSLEKYRGEAEISARLNCDFIVRYMYSWTEEGRRIYIQMELCDDNLRNILNIKRQVFNRSEGQSQNPLEFFISCEIFVELLKGVKYLHELNPPLIHRDLKPENILITLNSKSGNFFKVSDFGLSTNHDQSSMYHTLGTGTLNYQAPEVASGRKYNEMADVYSLGIIGQELFEIDFYEPKDCLPFTQNIQKCNTMLEVIIESMLRSPDYRKRSTCAQVLDKKTQWAIDVNEVKNWENFNQFIETLKRNENQFFYKFLTQKGLK